MEINLKAGTIKIDNVIFQNGYTFEDFKKTNFFLNHDGIRYIDLSKDHFDKYDVYTRLFWSNGKLSRISLMLDTNEFLSFEQEYERKKLHDLFLGKYGIKNNTTYEWGRIESVFDSRGCISTIEFVFLD